MNERIVLEKRELLKQRMKDEIERVKIETDDSTKKSTSNQVGVDGKKRRPTTKDDDFENSEDDAMQTKKKKKIHKSQGIVESEDDD